MRRTLAAVFVAMPVSAAGAQIVVTPPGPPEKREFTPPPRRPQTLDQETIQRVIREQQGRGAERLDVASLELNGLERPYDAPASYDGPPPIYDVNLHYAALRRNPLIGEGDRAAIRRVVEQRYATMQAGIPDNLETYIDIDNGLIETIDLADIDTLGAITSRIQTMIQDGFLTQSLAGEGAISQQASRINTELLRRYQRARNEAGGGANSEMFRALMRDAVSEAVAAFNALLYEGSTRWDAVLAGLELPADAERRLRRTATETAGDGPPTAAEIDAEANRVKLAWRTLDLEQQQSVVRRILKTRPDGARPIVPKLELTYPGKEVLTPEELIARQQAAQASDEGAENPGGDDGR